MDSLILLDWVSQRLPTACFWGLIGGIIMTKLATKRGYTSYIENTDTISRELLTGIIPKGKRGSIGEETIASITLEPLAWHLALIMIPTGAGTYHYDLRQQSAGDRAP